MTAAALAPAASFLGVDVGTSGVRAALIDGSGTLLAEARAPYPHSDCDHPNHWWATLKTVITALGHRHTLDGLVQLAVDATSGTIVAVDTKGAALEALMYFDRTGCDILEGKNNAEGLGRAAWLLDKYPAARVCMQADWINGKLTGAFGISDYNNALKLGFDAINLEWPDWVAEIVPLEKLPAVRAPGDPLGNIRPDTAKELGLPQSVQVVCGTTDGIAGFLATGAHEIGDAVTSLGSTIILKLLTDTPVNDTATGVYSHRLGDLYLAGGASNSGGAVLAQFFSNEELESLSAKIDSSTPSGLDYYPLPKKGERFPINDPELTPSMSPRPDDDVEFLKALLEGMSSIEAKGYETLHALGAPAPARVLTVGGGAQNTVWCAMRQGMLDTEVFAADHHEPAYGAALIAAGVIRAQFCKSKQRQ